jgi:hypothetical protein
MPFCPEQDIQRASDALNATFAGEHRLTTGCKIELAIRLLLTGFSEALPSDRPFLVQRLMRRLFVLPLPKRRRPRQAAAMPVPIPVPMPLAQRALLH